MATRLEGFLGVRVFPDLDLHTHLAAKLIGAEAKKISEIDRQRHPEGNLGKPLDLDLNLMLAGLGVIQAVVLMPQFMAEYAEMGIRELTGKRASGISQDLGVSVEK